MNECTKTTDFICSLAAVAPLWKRLMVWHDSVYAIRVYEFYLYTTESMHIHIHIHIYGFVSYTSHYIRHRRHCDLFVWIRFFRRVLHFFQHQFEAHVHRLEMETATYSEAISWQSEFIAKQHTLSGALYCRTCALTTVAHLFNPIHL